MASAEELLREIASRLGDLPQKLGDILLRGKLTESYFGTEEEAKSGSGEEKKGGKGKEKEASGGVAGHAETLSADFGSEKAQSLRGLARSVDSLLPGSPLGQVVSTFDKLQSLASSIDRAFKAFAPEKPPEKRQAEIPSVLPLTAEEQARLDKEKANADLWNKLSEWSKNEQPLPVEEVPPPIPLHGVPAASSPLDVGPEFWGDKLPLAGMEAPASPTIPVELEPMLVPPDVPATHKSYMLFDEGPQLVPPEPGPEPSEPLPPAPEGPRTPLETPWLGPRAVRAEPIPSLPEGPRIPLEENIPLGPQPLPRHQPSDPAIDALERDDMEDLIEALKDLTAAVKKHWKEGGHEGEMQEAAAKVQSVGGSEESAPAHGDSLAAKAIHETGKVMEMLRVTELLMEAGGA